MNASLPDLFKSWLGGLRKFGLHRRVIRRIRGTGNRIAIEPSILNQVVFDIKGSDNTITIERDCILNQVTFMIRGSGHVIHIGRRAAFRDPGSVLRMASRSCVIEIGAESTFEQVYLAATEEGGRIEVGRDCMFAHEVDVRTSDSHSVVDLATGGRINQPGSVVIGDHVWVGKRAAILKGVTIGHDSVIAFGSIVTREVPAESVAAGMPAKIIRSGVSWKRERIQTARGD